MVHRRWWLVVGVLFTSMTGLAAAQLPAVPPVQTPPVPTATALPVPTPALPTPPPVPTVSVPKPPAVTVPVPGPAPAVSAPSVSTPSVSTPAGSVPSVTTPSVSTTSAAARAGSGSAPSSSGGSSGSAASGGASGASGATGTTPGGSGSPAAGGSGSGANSAGSRSSNGLSDSPAAAKARRRDHALRRAVLRLQGCLPRVPRSERRVLTLRAGVGAARAHSRTEVARITHLRRARVITLERRGLRRLHALGRTGACQDTQTASATSPPAAAGAPPPGSAPGTRGAVLAERQVSDKTAGGAQRHRKPTAELSISRPPIAPGTGGFDLTLVFAALGVLAFVFVVTREVKRTD